MRADTLSCLAGFCWLTHLVCFLHPERGTGVGAGSGRASERIEAGCGVPWSHCSASFKKEKS